MIGKVATSTVCALSFLLIVSTALACPKTSVSDVEDEVMCPVCGTLLAVAEEAPQAKRERLFIKEQVAKCASKSEIKRRLVAQYGNGILALPEKKGFSLSAWIVPVAVLLVALFGIGIALFRWRREDKQTPAPSLSEQSSRRIDHELKKLDP